jgi:hypothetical protein
VSTVDESHAQEFEAWIRDAREGGLPVIVTGVVASGALGIPFPTTLLLLWMLMALVLLGTAWVEFGPDAAEDHSL